MARQKAKVEIEVESFIRTRDSVVTGLATLQDAIQTLSTAYIKHTNAVLGEHGAGLDISTALSKLGENPLLGPLANLQPATNALGGAVAAADAAGTDKKDRKKRQHDPNAPKRPLTPFFLYMQTARPIIASDLGPGVPKGAVSEEGTRRWKEMSDKDRLLWANAYKDNLRLYNARMHAYKHGRTNAKDMDDLQALQYAESNSIGADTTADAQLVGEAAAAPEDADAEGESDKEPTPPPKPAAKTAKPAANRKGKKGASAEAAEPATPSEPIRPAAAPTPKKDTPAGSNKRKRAKKGDEPAAETDEPADTPKAANKPRQKKAKKGDA